MSTASFLHNPIVQLGYHVPDVEAAARQFADNFGWGPFFVVHHIKIKDCMYRGQPSTFDHSSAYGQAGSIMVELLQQHGDEPSAIRDMYTADQFGLQHHASFTDDLDRHIKHFQTLGFPTIMHGLTETGIEFVFIDTRPLLGYMLELYPKSDFLVNWYGMVRDAAKDWDGKNPLRFLS